MLRTGPFRRHGPFLRLVGATLATAFLLVTGPGALIAHSCEHRGSEAEAGHAHAGMEGAPASEGSRGHVALPCASDGAEEAEAHSLPDGPSGNPCECVTDCCAVSGFIRPPHDRGQALVPVSVLGGPLVASVTVLPASPKYVLPFPNAPPL